MRVVELDDRTRFTIGALTGRAVANSHFDHDGRSVPGQVSLSYRFEMGGRSIVYTGDTGPSPAVERLAQGADMLVSEVIDLEPVLADIRKRRTDAPPQMFAQISKHMSTHHLLPADIGAMAARAQVGGVVLTHFAVPGSLAESEPALRAGLRQSYAGTVDLARDLASFDVGCGIRR